MRKADLLIFRHVVRKADCDSGLETAALLVAETEYPKLDIAECLGVLDRWGRRARRLVAGARGGAEPPIVPVLDLLYREIGLRGNVGDYYDPRNSFLNEVVERRLGIPITLGIVLMSVCRRAGVAAEGVSFPGHFLVRTTDALGTPLFVDPFEGRPLDDDSLQLLYEQATGDPGELDPGYLVAATRKQILARLLNNLRAIYEVRGDRRRLKKILERMAILNPGDDVDARLALLRFNAQLPVRPAVN
jgi:regulator of sirC expression with transglutaminase-like and TPR domain